MASKFYRKIDGKWQELGTSSSDDVNAPAVHGDEMDKLTHPITGEEVTSRNRWNAINKEHGVEVVGNDLLSKQKRNIPDRITEERILDAIHKAEATVGNYDKLSEARGRNRHYYEMGLRLLNGAR